MKDLIRGILLIGFAFALGLTPALEAASGDRFAAIAYAPTSGRWGSATNYPARSAATARALRECGSAGAQSSWCRNAWMALALSNRSPGGFGWAYGNSAYAARSNALRQCLAKNPDAHVLACVFTYGR